ncbi:YopX family protein [Zhenhengia yiwuensis]|uniref:YopX family protein n=1 Tax=Zhenhengia yiwuensis TaxID=2763666 RepID=UPI002015FEBF
MRAIKFRAWDAKYKYMNYKVMVGMYGDNVMDDENYTACSMWIEPKKVDYKCEPHWGNFEPYHKDILLMQYTGLKDNNGKEIYEGDIVEAQCIGGRDFKGVVKFYDCEFVIDNGEDAIPLFDKVDLRIVMGNIYENPELLEVLNDIRRQEIIKGLEDLKDHCEDMCGEEGDQWAKDVQILNEAICLIGKI